MSEVRLASVLLALVLITSGALADRQQDPELKSVLQKAITAGQCFTEKYDAEVWYKLMEPRLRKYVKDLGERIEILTNVYCEARNTQLPAELVLAVMDVESSFNRWAVSSAGAQGLMQVMPFWPEQLGMQRHQLVQIQPNIRMGCAILKFYLRSRATGCTQGARALQRQRRPARLSRSRHHSLDVALEGLTPLTGSRSRHASARLLRARPSRLPQCRPATHSSPPRANAEMLRPSLPPARQHLNTPIGKIARIALKSQGGCLTGCSSAIEHALHAPADQGSFADPLVHSDGQDSEAVVASFCASMACDRACSACLRAAP